MTSLRRLYAMLLRQFYLVRGAPPRLVSYLFWPLLQMMIWGLFNNYLFKDHQILGFSLSTLLGAALLLTIVERTNSNVMIAFLEDIWTRNLGNISITPLTRLEMGISFLVIATLSITISVSVAATVAYFVFDYSFLSLGMPLILWWLVLTMTGWSIGLLIVSMLLRFGTGNEAFGWMFALALSPFFCAFYPVSAMPHGMQYFALMLPPTYVFEGLRVYLKTQSFDYPLFFKGLSLAGFYLALSFANFFRQLQQARMRTGLFNVIT